MGLISTIQNKTEQARAKERIKPLLESRMMRDILLEVGQRGTEKLDPQSVPLEQRPRAAKLAAALRAAVERKWPDHFCIIKLEPDYSAGIHETK